MNFLLKGARNILHVMSKYGLRVAIKALMNYQGAYFRKLQLPLPVEIQIEPSSVGNLHCRMCGLNKGTRKAFLKPEQFEYILDKLGTLKGINLTGMGEGLLNNGLEKLIGLAARRGIDVGFITNGLLMTEDRINSLLSTSLRSITISLESAVPGIYEKIRLGGSIEKLLENLRLLDNAAISSNSEILIYLNTVLVKDLLDDLNNVRSVVDLASRYPSISGVTFQNVHDVFSQNTASLYDCHGATIKDIFRRIKLYAEENKVEISIPPSCIMKSSCFYPWVYPYITVFGDVLPCCILPQFGAYSEMIRDYSFGNIFTEDINDIWNGNRAMSFRRQMITDPTPFCKRCSKYLNIL